MISNVTDGVGGHVTLARARRWIPLPAEHPSGPTSGTQLHHDIGGVMTVIH